MPNIKANDEINDFHTLWLRIPATNLTDVRIDGRIAHKHSDEEGNGGAYKQEGDEGLMDDHPIARRKGRKSHVEEDNGYFDECKGNVEEGKGRDYNLYKYQPDASCIRIELRPTYRLMVSKLPVCHIIDVFPSTGIHELVAVKDRRGHG